jgi:hypothetical protein
MVRKGFNYPSYLEDWPATRHRSTSKREKEESGVNSLRKQLDKNFNTQLQGLANRLERSLKPRFGKGGLFLRGMPTPPRVFTFALLTTLCWRALFMEWSKRANRLGFLF